MSVRDAAGRHPRRSRGDGPTDGPAATRRRGTPTRRPVHARPTKATRPSSPAPLRAPLIVCLVAVVVAFAEAGASGPDAGDGSRVASGRSSPVTAAIGAGRVAAGPDLDRDPKPVGDAPRRTVPALLGASASALASAAFADASPPPCTYDDLPAPYAALDQWATSIVDTAFALPAGYHPLDLVPVGRAGIRGGGLVRSFVIHDLRALAAAADEAGNPVAVQSAYRTRARQAEVFAGWVASAGEDGARRFSARPGHSEHQLGTALDLRAAAGGAPWSGAFGATAAGRWLAKHAHEFGFVLSYPKGADAVTCYGAEAWHVRYVGRAIAAEVQASKLPLRVWLWRFGGDR